jgi:periplasmic divalent cation tolerance protein
MIVILCTANEENAKLIVRTLVEEELAACVNSMPVTSTYRWQDEIVEDTEQLLIIKTKNYERVEARIKELHTYEVPEIIALEIKQGSKEYLDWIGGN